MYDLRPISCVALSTFLHPFLASSYPLNRNFSKRASFPRNLTLQKLCRHFFHQITTSPLLSPNPKRKSGSSSRGEVIVHAPRHICCSSSLLLFMFFFDIESARKNHTVFYSWTSIALPRQPRRCFERRQVCSWGPRTHSLRI